MIYPGSKKDIPEYVTLIDEFFDGEDIPIDAKVKVLCDGSEPGDIVNQYILFTKIVTDQIKIHGRTQKAVEEIIRICMDSNVLKEYLSERKVEVMDILTSLFDQDVVTERHEKALVKENSKEIALKMIARGTMSIEEIAEDTGLSIEEVEELRNLQPV